MKLRALEIAVSFVISMVLIMVSLIPGQTQTIWGDPVTGSVKTQTSWLGFGQMPVIATSALERWIVEHDGSHLSTWRPVTRARWTIYGRPLDVSCSERPMFLLRAGDRNDRFVRTSTDSQIARFVQIMRIGSEAEKTQAIQSASDAVTAME